jgi:hypothetical protein
VCRQVWKYSPPSNSPGGEPLWAHFRKYAAIATPSRSLQGSQSAKLRKGWAVLERVGELERWPQPACMGGGAVDEDACTGTGDGVSSVFVGGEDGMFGRWV